MKRILTILFSLTLVAQTYVPYVYAQEATGSAGFSASSSAQLQIASSSGQLLPQDPQQQAVFLGVNQLNITSANTSATVAQKQVVLALPQKSYKAEDSVEVTVGNSSPDSVKVKLIDFYGLDATNKFVVQKFANGSQTIIDITPPVSRFKPGKYTIQITDAQGNTSTQDFTWGVLAINTNKSIYVPNETAQIAMAVLDNNGNMVCDADVTLAITDSLGKTTTLTTKNGNIIVNDICTKHEFSLTPDYQTSYTVSGAGKYTMNLSATTSNGTYSISDSFDVRSAVDFDVERSSATRLYPPLWYPVNMTITANKDFSGVITDYVPATFDISPATSSAVMSYTQVKTVYPGENGPKDLFGVPTLHLDMPFTGNFSVTQGFGEQLTDPTEKQKYSFYHVLGHDGIDFALPVGTPVLSADDGIVVLADENGDYGTTIVVRHTWGQSYYGHLSKMEAKVGDSVHRGQELGLSGNSGLADGAHLHFGIKPVHPEMGNGFFGKVDPAPYLQLSPADTATWSVNTRLGNQPLKVIQWEVNVKKGDILTMGYQFKAPRVSPEFYTLGPLHFIDTDGNVQFTESRLWQLAADVSMGPTFSPSPTSSSVITGGGAWNFGALGLANNTTTKITYKKNTGYFQWTPGATNAPTNGGASAPTTPNGKGWIYDTVADSTIPSGTWNFSPANTNSTLAGTGHLVVCAWKVKITSGAISASASILPCTEDTTDNLLGTTAGTNQINFNTGSIAAQSLAYNEYFYVEYWLRVTVAGSSNTAAITFDIPSNTAVFSNSMSIPGSSSNLSPNIPTQSTPANSTTGVSTSPAFTMSTTDPETDNLQYKITLYSNSGCTSVVQTNDQSSSQTGWSGQNATCSVANDCYTSGTTSTYATQTSLSANTQYWWRASAKDPTGSNAFTDSSTCNTFTTGVGGPTLDQLMRHGKWFNNGVKQPFTF